MGARPCRADVWNLSPFRTLLQVQLLGQAVEDVFSSPAVMLSLFEVQHSLVDLMDADADAGAAATKAAAATEAQNRAGQAGAREQEHGLDLDFMNALYTALLKVHCPSLKRPEGISELRFSHLVCPVYVSLYTVQCPVRKSCLRWSFFCNFIGF